MSILVELHRNRLDDDIFSMRRLVAAEYQQFTVIERNSSPLHGKPISGRCVSVRQAISGSDQRLHHTFVYSYNSGNKLYCVRGTIKTTYAEPNKRHLSCHSNSRHADGCLVAAIFCLHVHFGWSQRLGAILLVLFLLLYDWPRTYGFPHIFNMADRRIGCSKIYLCLPSIDRKTALHIVQLDACGIRSFCGCILIASYTIYRYDLRCSSFVIQTGCEEGASWRIFLTCA